MYEKHWGLQKTPFGTDRSPQSYFASTTHQSALLKLRFLVEHRRGIGLLVGPPGSGKSRLLHSLLRNGAASSIPVIEVLYPLMSPLELLSFIVEELQDSPNHRTELSMSALLKQLVDRLEALTSEGNPAVIVVDDAQAITDRSVFEMLQLLLNLQQNPGVEFTLILAGHPDLVSTARRIPQLDDRISIPCVLTPMNSHETAEYVQHQLRAAGGTDAIFSRAALQAVHELSGGLPRRINRLCDFALLVGFAEDLGLIDSHHVEGVSAELSLGRVA